MTGSEGKEGGGFELYVAAALKYEAQKADGKNIDLTGYHFNPKPKTFLRTLTNAGYDITVDIWAASIGGNIEYAIECKSSIHRDQILVEKSDQFLEGMLEFLALEGIAESSKWQYNYILAANFPISRKIASLIKARSPRQLNAVRKLIISFGIKNKPQFNQRVASAKKIGQVFGKLALIEFPDQYINKLKQNSDYAKIYDAFADQLKPLHMNIILGGAIDVLRFERISFLCGDPNHLTCQDIGVNGVVCHLGKVQDFRKQVICLEKDVKHLKLIKLADLGYSVQAISGPSNYSSQEIAEAISAALNKCLGLTRLVYLVPGTYDILLINSEDMIERIKNSLDAKTMKYLLDQVSELKGLGSALKVSLARAIFAFYHVMITENDFISNE